MKFILTVTNPQPINYQAMSGMNERPPITKTVEAKGFYVEAGMVFFTDPTDDMVACYPTSRVLSIEREVVPA
jgi:hypothetical protein